MRLADWEGGVKAKGFEKSAYPFYPVGGFLGGIIGYGTLTSGVSILVGFDRSERAVTETHQSGEN